MTKLYCRKNQLAGLSIWSPSDTVKKRWFKATATILTGQDGFLPHQVPTSNFQPNQPQLLQATSHTLRNISIIKHERHKTTTHTLDYVVLLLIVSDDLHEATSNKARTMQSRSRKITFFSGMASLPMFEVTTAQRFDLSICGERSSFTQRCDKGMKMYWMGHADIPIASEYSMFLQQNCNSCKEPLNCWGLLLMSYLMIDHDIQWVFYQIEMDIKVACI